MVEISIRTGTKFVKVFPLNSGIRGKCKSPNPHANCPMFNSAINQS